MRLKHPGTFAERPSALVKPLATERSAGDRVNEHAVLEIRLASIAFDFKREEKFLANRNQDALTSLLCEAVDLVGFPVDFAPSQPDSIAAAEPGPAQKQKRQRVFVGNSAIAFSACLASPSLSKYPLSSA